MCKLLNIPRSSLYYNANHKHGNRYNDDEIISHIVDIFKQSRNNYGSRKIKVELYKQGFTVSRRRIRRVMNEQGLVSN